MKIPKLNQTPQKVSNIVYPKVTTWDIIKEYGKLMKPYWLQAVLVVCGVSLATITGSTIVPTYYKKFFDLLSTVSNTPTRDVAPLIAIIFSVLFLNVLNWIGWRVSWFAENYMNGHVIADAMQKSFDYTIEHSNSFFASTFTGSLTQKINRFGRAFDNLFDSVFFDLLTLFLRIFGAGIVLYMTRPALAFAIGIWIVLFLSVSFFFSRMKLKYDVEAAALYSKLGGAFADSISNHTAVQSFSRYDTESKSIKGIITSLREMNLFRWYFGNTLDAVQSLLSLGIEFFVFYYGIHYWQMGLITLGTFVLAQTYIISIGQSLWGFSRIIRNINESLADAKEMVEILHLKHEIVDVEHAHKLEVPHGKIEFRDVSFAFGENKPVFSGINLYIKPGEKVALIGSSGAGKSTLVKLLLRQYDIQKGEIFIDGQNIHNVTQNSLRENISLVPQDPALFHRSLMENIRYGKMDTTDAEVIEAAKLAHCDIFIKEFPQKYETFVGERGVKLSGGERQRVAIARAILKNAPILVLDEATSSLDSHSESLIQDALHTLMKGKTTIVIAHRLSTIRNMDRIVVVSKGGVVEDGSHDELLQKKDGIYAKLWSLQAGGFADKSIEELLDE